MNIYFLLFPKGSGIRTTSDYNIIIIKLKKKIRIFLFNMYFNGFAYGGINSI